MATKRPTKGAYYLLDPMGKTGMIGHDTVAGICIEPGPSRSVFMCLHNTDRYVTLPNKYVIEIDPNYSDIASTTPVFRTTYPTRIEQADVDLLTKVIDVVESGEYQKPITRERMSACLKLLRSKLQRCAESEAEKEEYDIFYRTLNPFLEETRKEIQERKEEEEQSDALNDLIKNIMLQKFIDPVPAQLSSIMSRFGIEKSSENVAEVEKFISMLADDFFNDKLDKETYGQLVDNSTSWWDDPKEINMDSLVNHIYSHLCRSGSEDKIIIPFIVYNPTDDKTAGLQYDYFDIISEDFTLEKVREYIEEIIRENLSDKDRHIYQRTGKLAMNFDVITVAFPSYTLYKIISNGAENTINEDVKGDDYDN